MRAQRVPARDGHDTPLVIDAANAGGRAARSFPTGLALVEYSGSLRTPVALVTYRKIRVGYRVLNNDRSSDIAIVVHSICDVTYTSLWARTPRSGIAKTG